jgi:hypothetical protein
MVKIARNSIIVKKPNQLENFRAKTHGNSNAISTSKIKNKIPTT